ncbi:hypothetical protein KJ671_01585 [Patescibacteria group bacterium]|nr:hypothetical protein [Patescibacteria group bacterium]
MNILKNLQDLIDFGYQSINKALISGDSRNYRQMILFEMMGAIHKYSVAILHLCRQGQGEAGQVLLRSIVEANINWQYISAVKSDERVIGFIFSDNKDRIKLGNKFLDFKSRYPTHKSRFWELNKKREGFKSLVDKLTAENNQLKRICNKIEWNDNLKERSLAVDKIYKNGALEFLYLTVYWLFSHLTHLSARGLDNFLVRQSDKILFKINPSSDGINELAISTYANYLGFLTEFGKFFKTPMKQELLKFERIFKKLS